MNKTEIVELTARDAEVTKKVARKVIQSYHKTLRAGISQGEEIVLPRVGKFTYRHVPERPYNFGDKSGIVPEHYRSVFKVSAGLKKEVNALPVSYFELEEEEGDFEEE